MAPKKKAPAKEGEEDLLANYDRDYKKLCRQYELKENPDAKRSKELVEAGEEVPFWYFYEELEIMAFRLCMQALASSNYNQIKALRLWKTGGGDEAARAICFYLDSHCQKTQGEGVKEVQLVDINLGTLGCSFLGRSLGPHLDENQKLTSGNINVQCLVLDYNQIGSEGMEQLALGLAQNSYLQRLDLNYCGIDSKGGRFLFEILIYVYSNLEQLYLRGNDLEKEGLLEVVRGAKRAKKLKLLDLADNKFGEDKDTLDALISLFTTNTSITNYDLVGNYITDVGAEKLIQGILGLSHLKQINIPEQCSEAAFTAMEGALGKGGGGKKGKKGKKKK
jgi:Ran GTPase-activating protein (RanGAP) involved in mRNA processing and transport